MPQTATLRISSPLLSGYAGELLVKADEVADEVFTAITSTERIYQGMGPNERRDVRDAVGRNFHEQLEGIAAERPAEHRVCRETARRRAGQGVPLVPLLHAYRIGQQALWRRTLVEAQRCGAAAAEISDAMHILWRTADEMHGVVSEAYQEALGELTQHDDRRRTALLDALLDGRFGDWTALGGTSRSLGLPDLGPYVCVVADSAGAEGLAPALRRAAFDAAWRNRSDTLVGLVAVPGGEDATRAIPVLDEAAGGRVGVSPLYPALRDTAAALHLATLARASLPRGACGATTVDDDPIAALAVASPRIADRAVTAALGPVLRHPQRDLLLEALRAWLEAGGSIAEVSSRLYCHRNTVRNRLNRLAELTGKSLDNPADTALLYTAVRALYSNQH
jgi:hypothetical protein